MDFFTSVIIFIVGIAVAILGGMIGGGVGFVSVPFLMFIGLPPNVAIATNKFSALGSAVSTLYTFSRAKKITYWLAISFAGIGVIGAIVGANVLVGFDESLLARTVGILLLVLLPFIFLKEPSKKSIKKSPMWHIGGYILYIGVAIYGAFFGPGMALFGMYVMMFCFGLTQLESNATHRLPWLVHMIVTLVVFGLHDLIWFGYGFVLLAGRLVGGFIGSRIALKQDPTFLRILFALVVGGSAVKLLFF